MPSFGGIKRDCDAIMIELKAQLNSKLANNETSPAEMSECVTLLLQLEEPAEVLCQVFLETSGRRLDDSIAFLEKQISLASAGGILQKNPQVIANIYMVKASYHVSCIRSWSTEAPWRRLEF